jgi:hypothetical protein
VGTPERGKEGRERRQVREGEGGKERRVVLDYTGS